MDIRKVGLVGCGTMGTGIAEVAARCGARVTFVEVNEERVEAGRGRIARSLARALEHGKLEPAERDAALARVEGSTSYEAVADADLVVEAVPEDLALKKEVFRKLDAAVRPGAILATNTSSLSVTDLAVSTGRADRVVGFHFFNPAPVMRLVELVRTVVTDPDVVEACRAFAVRAGKTPVVAGDRAGFVANLLLFPYLNQAIEMLDRGYARREDIDAAMQLGAGHPMGPLALSDLIGLDSGAAIMETIYGRFRERRHAPPPIVRQLLAAGYHGRKTGRGFYTYAAPDSPEVVEDGGGVTGVVEAPGGADGAAVDGWRRAGVVGSGTMAAGIAEVLAAAGFEVVVLARSEGKARQAVATAVGAYDRAVARGRLDAAARDAAAARLHAAADPAALGGCDAVVEAVVEDLEVKREVFALLDRVAGAGALLATTTSSLPVVECAMATRRPERVVGLHFFNPVRAMRLVEVVETVRTDPVALAQARALVGRAGKHAVLCRDRAGFIVNALLFPYLNDAVRMLAEGYATVTDVDAAMKLGCGHPLGPFELMDVVGLDVTLEICRALHEEFREPAFEPVALLGSMVSAGYLGRKTGRGFYVYGEGRG